MRNAQLHSFAIAALSLAACCLPLSAFPVHASFDQGMSRPRRPQLVGGPEGTGSVPAVGQPAPPAGCFRVATTVMVGLGIDAQRQTCGGSEGTGSLPLTGLMHASIVQSPNCTRSPHIGGGADGAGSLPFAGTSVSPNARMHVATTATVGLVTDAHRDAVAGTLVVVTHPALGVVAQAFTDANGQFVVDLPDFAHLELALPDLAIAGIDVTAGAPVMIIVP